MNVSVLDWKKEKIRIMLTLWNSRHIVLKSKLSYEIRALIKIILISFTAEPRISLKTVGHQ
jgi:hypothetical protein